VKTPREITSRWILANHNSTWLPEPIATVAEMIEALQTELDEFGERAAD